MVKHIKVNSISTAWEVAASIFPTDYKKDEESSKRAGYPIYTTMDAGVLCCDDFS